jgi:hypothetical protein
VDLQDARIFRHHGRDHRALERPGGGNYAGGFDHAVRGFYAETRSANIPFHFRDLHAATDGRRDQFGVSDKIVRDPFLGGKGIGIDIGELQTGKSIVPGRTVGHQRVPSFRAPAFGNSATLQDEVRHAAVAEVLAHGQTGLAAANNEGLYFFN